MWSRSSAPERSRVSSWLGLLAGLYPLALAGIVVALGCAGERWWLTGVWLYVPRVVFAAPLPIVVLALVFARKWRALFTQVVSVALLLGLMGFVVPTPHLSSPASSPAGPVIRVLSYNVNSGLGGYGEIAKEIDRYAPDVVLLEEVASLPVIGDLMRARYPTVAASGQFLVASRYPIGPGHDPERLPYYGRLRSPRFVRWLIETPLGPIAFYEVHPISPREGFYAVREGGLKREILSGRLPSSKARKVVQYNSGLRQLQVETFTQQAEAETLPVVIAGDTNLPGLSHILGDALSGFQDGFAKASWGFGYTFPTNHLRPWMRIDRIFSSKALRFVHFETGRSLASDHLCVVADIEVTR